MWWLLWALAGERDRNVRQRRLKRQRQREYDQRPEVIAAWVREQERRRAMSRPEFRRQVALGLLMASPVLALLGWYCWATLSG